MTRTARAALLLAVATTTGCAHFRHREARHERAPRHHRAPAPLYASGQQHFDSFSPYLRCREQQHHLKAYIGQVATDHVVRMVRFYSRAAVVERVRPQDEAALVERPGRILLEEDDKGRVARIFCG